jgi:glyoxylase-like metal-dependent hydrolase (beta-lactamase superfamily II)
MSLTLEDNWSDVLNKAVRGTGSSAGKLAAALQESEAAVGAVLAGTFEEGLVRKVAGHLGLRADAVISLAAGSYPLPEIPQIEGLKVFSSQFENMVVNSYLIIDPATARAWIFDAGTDADAIWDYLEEERLTLDTIFITHNHGDHIFEFDRLKEKTGAPAWTSHLEPVEGASSFKPGKTFLLGTLSITTRLTSGHARGGITYIVDGLDRQIACVGDAIFAGSMGGGMVSYADALKTGRESILTLPDDTIIAPGHGPLTTVGNEKKNNPFFP